MTTKKNRVVRADDDLWDKVETEALRRNLSTAEHVRWTLWTHGANPPKCFLCGLSATDRHDVALSKGDDHEGVDGWVRAIASGEPVGDKYTPVTVTVYTCGEHDNGASGYLCDTFGGCSGQGLVRDRSHRATGTVAHSIHDPAYVELGKILQGVKRSV